MSTEFLRLVLKHLIVHTCGSLCTTVVHDFYCYESRAACSSPSASSRELVGGGPLLWG